MPKKEPNNSISKKKGKYFLFFLLLLIGYGLYQLMQSDSHTFSSTNRSEVAEKAPPKAKETPPVVIPDDNSKKVPPLNSERKIDPNTTTGTFTDTRDGQLYQWVRLKDGKKWMANNLNFQMTSTWCYEDNQDNCKQYGRLYTWQSAQGACPNGWRLPTDDEWWEMASFYGKAYNSYAGQEKMEGKDDGEDVYKALVQGGKAGFNVLFGGSYSVGEGFDYLGDLGYYWSSSAHNESNALGYYFYIRSRALARDSYHKTLGFSCRCLQD